MKVLLVDDHPMFLEGIKNFLEVNDIEVVGTAKCGAEALHKIGMAKPNLILMDVQMAESDGIDATRMIKEKYPDMEIVMFTASEDEDSLFAAMRAGASGYLLKSMEPDRFLRQLKGIEEGDMPIAPGLAKRFLQEFNRPRQKTENHADVQKTLTERQTEILQLLIEGLTYREMAEQLNLKETTVKYHIREILNKLQLSNRSQLLVYASRTGWNGDK